MLSKPANLRQSWRHCRKTRKAHCDIKYVICRVSKVGFLFPFVSGSVVLLQKKLFCINVTVHWQTGDKLLWAMQWQFGTMWDLWSMFAGWFYKGQEIRTCFPLPVCLLIKLSLALINIIKSVASHVNTDRVSICVVLYWLMMQQDCIRLLSVVDPYSGPLNIPLIIQHFYQQKQTQIHTRTQTLPNSHHERELRPVHVALGQCSCGYIEGGWVCGRRDVVMHRYLWRERFTFLTTWSSFFSL